MVANDLNAQEAIGFVLARWEEGLAEVELQLRDAHRNKNGTLHGGVICMLLDVAAAHAGSWTRAGESTRPTATTSITVNFVAPVQRGTVRAVGRVLALRNSGYISAGELFDDNGVVVATSQSSHQYLRRSEHVEGVSGLPGDAKADSS